MSHPANDLHVDNIREMLEGFTAREIINAINKLGVESLCGVSEVRESELGDFLIMMELHEVFEIAEQCQHTYCKEKGILEDQLKVDSMG